MQSETGFIKRIAIAEKLLGICEVVPDLFVCSKAGKEIASEAVIDPTFKTVRSWSKKQLFEYEAADETPTNPKELS